MKYLFHLFLYIYFFKYGKTLDNISEKCQELCSEEGGECGINLKCKCKEGYTTIFTEEKIILCNYKRFSKITGGLIELFFGFGFGHFYCKRYLNGYIQLFGYFLSYCLMACLFCYFLLYDNNFNLYFSLTNSFLKLYCPLAIVILFSWQFVDSILFFCGHYPDGNGIDLL